MTGEDAPAPPGTTASAADASYRALFEANPHPMWVFDSETLAFLEVNAAAIHFYGYSRDEFLAMTVLDIRPPEEHERILSDWRRAVPGFMASSGWRHLTKDGRVVVADTQSHPVIWQGRPARLVVAFDVTARSRAEAALRASEQRLAESMRVVRMACWEYDLAAREFLFSDEYYALHRTTAQAVGGYRVSLERFAQEFVHPDDAPIVGAATQEALASADPSWEHRVESRILCADGEARWVEVWFRVDRDPSGEAVRLVGISQDITGRRLAVDAMRQSQQVLQMVLDTIPVRVFWKDRTSRYLGCNRLFAYDAGLEHPADIVGRTDDDCPWVAEADAYRRDDARVMDSGEAMIGFDEVQTTPGGGRIVLHSSKVPLRDSAGRIVGVLGTYEDVTERRKAEEALRRSEALLRESQHVAALGHYALDFRDGAWTSSDALDEVFGIGPDYPRTPDGWLGLVAPADRDLMRGHLYETVFRDRQPFDMEYRIQRASDRAERWVHGIGRLEFDEAETPVKMFGTIQDITARRHAEEEKDRLQAQLLQAQKMESVGRLAGGVAHDFNNMLQAILGNIELALEDAPEPGPFREQLLEIQKVAQRSAELTRQLLGFARRQTISPRVLDLNEAIDVTFKMLRRLIGENIDLVWTPAPNLWPVKIDPSQVDQVLANLVVNARDAIRGVGAIELSTANIHLDDAYCADRPWAIPGFYVRLAVRDTGVGMSPDVQAHLFEPFFTTKELGKGTGLGLATVYGIVKQNGGAIDVTSGAGQGTTICVYLPRTGDSREPGAAEAVTCAPRHGSETLLVVEDEPAILNLTREVLERYGYTVLSVRSPEEAIRVAESYAGSIALLITDVVMPGMGGHALAAHVRALRPGIRTLFMSGYSADVLAQAGVAPERVHFIAKPFSASVLAVKVRESLA